MLCENVVIAGKRFLFSIFRTSYRRKSPPHPPHLTLPYIRECTTSYNTHRPLSTSTFYCCFRFYLSTLKNGGRARSIQLTHIDPFFFFTSVNGHPSNFIHRKMKNFLFQNHINWVR